MIDGFNVTFVNTKHMFGLVLIMITALLMAHRTRLAQTMNLSTVQQYISLHKYRRCCLTVQMKRLDALSTTPKNWLFVPEYIYIYIFAGP